MPQNTSQISLKSCPCPPGLSLGTRSAEGRVRRGRRKGGTSAGRAGCERPCGIRLGSHPRLPQLQKDGMWWETEALLPVTCREWVGFELFHAPLPFVIRVRVYSTLRYRLKCHDQTFLNVPNICVKRDTQKCRLCVMYRISSILSCMCLDVPGWLCPPNCRNGGQVPKVVESMNYETLTMRNVSRRRRRCTLPLHAHVFAIRAVCSTFKLANYRIQPLVDY